MKKNLILSFLILSVLVMMVGSVSAATVSYGTIGTGATTTYSDSTVKLYTANGGSGSAYVRLEIPEGIELDDIISLSYTAKVTDTGGTTSPLGGYAPEVVLNIDADGTDGLEGTGIDWMLLSHSASALNGDNFLSGDNWPTSAESVDLAFVNRDALTGYSYWSANDARNAFGDFWTPFSSVLSTLPKHGIESTDKVYSIDFVVGTSGNFDDMEVLFSNVELNEETYSVVPQEEWTADGETSIDALDEANTEVDITTTEEVTVTIETQTSPGDFPTGLKTAGKYINVEVSNEEVVEWPIYIKIYYTDDELVDAGLTEAQLTGIYFLDGDSWELYDDTGVNTDDSGDYSGYFWANADHLTPMGGGGDAEAPEITEIIVDSEYPETGESIQICADVTDNVEVSNVKLSCTSLIHTYSNLDMIGIGNRYCTWFNTDTIDGEEMSCEITATDTSSNSNTIPLNPFTYDGDDPIANANGPYTCDEGNTAPLDASASSDTVDTSLEYAWDLDNDEQYDDAFIVNPNFQCVDDGDYSVSVQVTDNVGNTDTADSTVTVNNVDPIAEANGPYSVDEGSSVVLSGTATDVPADSLEYAWDFDGVAGYEIPVQNPTFNCAQDGNYIVGLQVTDDDGGIGYDTATVLCHNVAPEIGEWFVTSPIYEEGTATLTASVSDIGSDDSEIDYSINWGDGSTETTDSTIDGTISETHQYMNDDTDDKYTITLTVTDSDGSTDFETKEITVLNKNPWNLGIVVDENPTIIDSVVHFTGSATDVGADTLTYSWDFGDENTGTGINPTHAYTTNGEYTVTMTVTDGDGGLSTDTLTVNVYQYNIQLNSGWNLISLPLIPEDISYNEVFDDIKCNIDKVWAYQYDEETGKNEWNFKDVNDNCEWVVAGELENIIPGYGYYIKMVDDDVLYQNGDKYYEVGQEDIPMPPQVELTTGWNLIGHYGMNDVSKAGEIQDLSGGVLTNLADVTLLNKNSLPIDTLIPTEGYWAFMTGQNNLWYAPSNADYA